MAEPETPTEDETMTSTTSNTSELLRQVKTRSDITEDTIKSKRSIKSTGSETSESSREERSWTESSSLGVKSYAESRLRSGKNDGRKTTASDVASSPGVEDIEGPFPLRECFPLGGFQLEHWARTAVGQDRRRRTRIWRSMRARQPTKVFRRTGRMPRVRSERLRPSFTRDAATGLGAREKEGRKRRRDLFPCDPSDDDEGEFRLCQQRSDFANRKELDYVRVPVSYPESKRKLTVERAVGERPGLVDGDYVIVKLPFNRVYANVVLRGLKGMHLLEMSLLRERKNTWKFCFYQAVVALLAKTQLRYKYAWSANIDYIYDHAWMLYTHIGTINVKARQRLDDIVVYNYKYSVEVELIQEMKDIVARYVDYKENSSVRQITLRRKDPLQVRAELGCQKMTDSGYVSVHEDVKELEELLGELTTRYRECILRTTRFSLAFWRDGLFWYLYNPYRCDEFGFWDDNGRACIVKFCSTDSLQRHLMVLLLRGYAYEAFHSRNDDLSEAADDGNGRLDVQIFHVSFHCCELDNPKLLRRGKQPRRVDDGPSDSLEIEDQEDEEIGREEDEEGDSKEPREKATWLRCCRAMTWGKCVDQTRKRPDSAEIAVATKARWHQYYVEEPNRLFSLWGEIHPTDDIFDETNRGMQAYACYMVCAGMTMITAPEYWSPKTLDAIVVCGDRYYTRSKREAELKSDADASDPFKHLSDRFEIGEILLEARMLPAVRGRLYVKSSECLWGTLKRVFSSYHFATLTCESACLGLFKFCGAYYMCDVNSFGPPLFSYGHGAAYLLRATSFRKFMTVLVLTIGSPERSRFSLNPIEILKIVEIDTPESRAKTRERGRRFGKFAGKIPGKLSRFAPDEQKKRKIKK